MHKGMVYAALGAVCVLLLSVMVWPSAVAYGQDEIAVIISVQGAVSVKLPQKRWVPAKKDMPVTDGAAIKTGRGAYCDIALDSSRKNIISIGPLTEIVLGEYYASLDIAKGRVFALLDGLAPGSVFEVRTPVASGGARGTAWETVVKNTTAFNVVDDTVEVTGKNAKGKKTGTSNVPAGNSLGVNRLGQLGAVTPLSPKELQRLRNWLRAIRQRAQASSKKKQADKLIDDYDGSPAGLFGQVLESEAQEHPGAFQPPRDGGQATMPPGGNTPAGPGAIGGDITTQTFTPEPAAGGGGGYQVEP